MTIKKRFSAAGAFALMASVGTAGFAQAQDAGPGFYNRLAIGVTSAQSMTFADATTANLTVDPKTGWMVEGTLGYRFTDLLRAEIDVSYGRNNLSGDYRENVLPIIPCGEFANTPCLDPAVNGDLGTLSGFAMAYADVPVAVALRPYVGAGVGLIHADMDLGTRATLNTGEVSRFTIIDANDDVIGYRLAAGVSYGLSFAELNVGYTFTSSGRLSLPGDGTLVNFTFDKRMKVHALSAGLTFRF